MNYLRPFFAIILFLSLLSSAKSDEVASRHFPAGQQKILIPTVSGVRVDLLKNIAPIIEKSIADGSYPGAVVLAAHRGHIIYRGVFGNRRIVPNVAPMEFTTIFDLASLTKVVATTPAVMQLVEQGKLDLDASVAKYWPAFATNQKSTVTVRELMTHTSGLQADVDGNSKTDILNKIENIKLQNPPGTTYVYSDINFIVLAHLVEIISGESFDQYVQNHIFKTLQMKDTSFLPSVKLHDRIAPTEIIDDHLRWGEVHDPSAHTMEGVSGNAGLFSDASDLGIYAQTLLNSGRIPGSDKNKKPRYFLGPLTIEKMTTPQMPARILSPRGLGWDIDSSYSDRGVLFPIHSFGHTGWTGTSIWIDPVTQTWLIILTSRTHPHPANENQIVQDRRTIANIVAASITDIVAYQQNNTGRGELSRAYL